GQRNGPAILAAEESAGTVDGIDDEDALAVEPGGIVGRLLAQPAIAGTGAQQVGGEELVDDDIGLADRRGIALGPGFDVLAEIAAGDDSGGHGGGAQKLQIVAIGRSSGWHGGAFRPRRGFGQGAGPALTNATGGKQLFLG